MSEYQYYEFRAIDRPLTPDQMAELEALSSRAEITETGFSVAYNWGEFRGEPLALLSELFDAYLYMANWGSRELLFRMPKHLFQKELILPYLVDNLSVVREGDTHVIFGYDDSEVEDSDWVDGTGLLTALVPLRQDLLNGDRRMLYLGWLKGVDTGWTDNHEEEPPVSPGLSTLNPALKSFTDFLGIDPDLIAAAAERSDSLKKRAPSKKALTAWVTALPETEKNQLLLELIQGEPIHLAQALKQRFEKTRAKKNTARKRPPARPRTAGELAKRAEELEIQRENEASTRRKQERQEQERIQATLRKKHLDSLVGQEPTLWQKVDELISTQNPKRYDEAVTLLQDLRDLADLKNDIPDFAADMKILYVKNARKPTLIKRFQLAGFVF